MTDTQLFSSSDDATEDTVDAGDAATILGDPPSTFEFKRRALELALDRATGRRIDIPEFDDPRAEKAWRARACLIVPEWRAVKLPFGKWVYSRAALLEFRAQPYAAVLAALPARCTPARGEQASAVVSDGR